LKSDIVSVVGGGLAGCECAWQLARTGLEVHLHEMRPERPTPVHQGDRLGELVCSNSLRSDDPIHPAGMLKREMDHAGSLIMAMARRWSVPAGSALATDRNRFSESITEAITSHPRIQVIRGEVTEIPPGWAVIATGPLTSDQLHAVLCEKTGHPLYFYDAVSPVVTQESLDMERLFFGSRYGKGGDDYLNCPMDEEEYLCFYEALTAAEVVDIPDFERAIFFEGCLPIEEMARRGKDTLCYGPFKPVGFVDPRTGRRPHALVQLRREDFDGTTFSLVGCQTRMKHGSQRRVFRLIPGFEHAAFKRMGQMHRNTYIPAPACLDSFLRLKDSPSLFFAGQITGVEGYLESAATGFLAGIYLSRLFQQKEIVPVPPDTAMGGLIRHLTLSDPERFLPSNISFGLIEDGSRKYKRETSARAEKSFQAWWDPIGRELHSDLQEIHK